MMTSIKSNMPEGHQEKIQEWFKKKTDLQILESLRLMLGVFMCGQSVYYLRCTADDKRLEVFNSDVQTFLDELIARQKESALAEKRSSVFANAVSGKTLQRFFQENQRQGLTFLPPTA